MLGNVNCEYEATKTAKHTKTKPHLVSGRCMLGHLQAYLGSAYSVMPAAESAAFIVESVAITKSAYSGAGL